MYRPRACLIISHARKFQLAISSCLAQWIYNAHYRNRAADKLTLIRPHSINDLRTDRFWASANKILWMHNSMASSFP